MIRTNVYTLMSVAVRVVALFFVFGTLVEVLTLIPMAVAYGADEALGWQLGFFVLQLLLFGLVWLFADVLVRLALGRPGGQVFESALDVSAWRVIGFSTIGIWFAATGLHGMVDQLLAGLWWKQQEMQGVDTMPAIYRGAGSSLAKFAIGIALLFGARGLDGLLQRMRGQHAAVAPAATSDEA